LEVKQAQKKKNFSNEDDSMIWQFSSNGVHSSRSLYKIINCRGVMPAYTPTVWKLKIPPRVHGFVPSL